MERELSIWVSRPRIA